MTTYELLKAETNATTDYLLTRDGKVISRWPELDCPTDVVNLDIWDDQAAMGHDLSDYQAALDHGWFDVSVITHEEY